MRLWPWGRNGKQPAGDQASGGEASAESNGQPESRLSPPVCPYHGRTCEVERTTPFFFHYACPEKGCPFSHKVPQPDIRQRLAELPHRQTDFSARPGRVYLASPIRRRLLPVDIPDTTT